MLDTSMEDLALVLAKEERFPLNKGELVILLMNDKTNYNNKKYMARKTVMLVFGTRPEAIKMCPLVKEFQKHPSEFETIVCVTGQHREMLDQVLTIFDVKPDYDLNIMKQGQDLYDVTARVLTGMRDVFKECKPDVVLVHGDTTTSTAAALAAFYQQIPVGHVEAGLRTHNIYSPWPEEMNRQITGRIATYDFAPTPLSEKNLQEEKAHGQIFVTGNTVIDALHMVVDKLKNDAALAKAQDKVLADAGYDVTRLDGGKKLVLITGHRRENFGEGFISMVTAMKDLSEKYPDVDFVYPMHLNPNVRKPIHEVFGEDLTRPNFFFIEPLQYLEFVYLMEKSTVVLTDSGGIQEEAPGLGKPVLVMRDTTERPEALKSGTVHLVGTNHDLIVSEVSTLLDDPAAYERMSKAVNPYGDGKACSRIVRALKGEEVDRYEV
jgi:UDP-N-acetylglucosamine 2-epimerase (non-hydrolysing)